MQNNPTSIMIVVGEPSGDAHAAKLVRELRARTEPERTIEIFGSTGPQLREAGVETIVSADDLAIVGVPEIARALPVFWNAFKRLKAEAKRRRPDVVILVDFPEFNLKLARSLKKLGLRVVYYISPQLWAWRRYRVRTIKRDVDLLLAILPFEKDWYSIRGVDHVEYVGSPLAREVKPKLDRETFCRSHGLNASRPMIALLPGSRRTEITRHLPIMLEAASKLLIPMPEVQFVIALSENRSASEVDTAFEAAGIVKRQKAAFTTVKNETFDALAAADAAAVCSGTATLEAGIIQTPMVVIYKGSALNYRLLMPLIDVEHFGLVNLIAGERLATELIQNDLTPEKLAAELERLLEPKVNQEMRGKLKLVSERLGSGGASGRAADAILRLLRN
ncbi:MAG: lipid-A-disaccharide synthase [Pyrinomonadaceae bacterium]|nr:lipid-A-disaccharide synthase [Pyrinomonadaceae bacterium]